MRPKPEFPRSPFPELDRQDQIKRYDRDLLSWYKTMEQDPLIQRILDIPTKGPIFILDARDIYAPETIDFWLGLAQRTVSVEKFGRAVKDYQEMIEWQSQNPEKVKIPD